MMLAEKDWPPRGELGKAVPIEDPGGAARRHCCGCRVLNFGAELAEISRWITKPSTTRPRPTSPELRQAFKHYMQAVGGTEGVYLVDHITDERSATIAQLLLLEVMEEDFRRVESPQSDS